MKKILIMLFVILILVLTACRRVDLQVGTIIKDDTKAHPEPIKLTVPITNNGEDIANLALIIDNTNFDVTITPETVELREGDTKNFNISLRAKLSTTSGDKVIKIMYDADGKKGSLTEVMVTVRKKALKIIPQDLVADNEVEKEMTVDIENGDSVTYSGINILLEPQIKDPSYFEVTRQISDNIKSIKKTEKGWTIELNDIPTGTIKAIFVVKATNPSKTDKFEFDLHWFLREGESPLLHGVKTNAVINP